MRGDRDEHPETAIRERLLADHRDTIVATFDAAKAAAERWEGSTADRTVVVATLSDELTERALQNRLPAVIETAAEAADIELPAPPVPAPPYVVMTGRGPILRATGERRRVVIVVAAFAAVGRTERGPRYRFRGANPMDALTVSIVR